MDAKKSIPGFAGETPAGVDHANPPKPLEPVKTEHKDGAFAAAEPEHITAEHLAAHQKKNVA